MTRLNKRFNHLSLVRSRIIHDVGWRSTASEFARHEPHRAIDVPEELLIATTEIVEAGLAIGRDMINRFLGHSPLQTNRTSHLRQYSGRASSLSRPNFRCFREAAIWKRGLTLMFPRRYLGSTKWSHE
jgi:hypothetical protein